MLMEWRAVIVNKTEVYLVNNLTNEEIHEGDRVLALVDITEGMLDNDAPPDDVAVEIGATGTVALIYVPDDLILDLCVEVIWDNWQAASRIWFVSPEWIRVIKLKDVA